jgi:hypothetical protein
MLRKDLKFAHPFNRSSEESGFRYEVPVEGKDDEWVSKYVWVHAFEAISTAPASGQVKVVWCMPDEEAEHRGGPPDVSVELISNRPDDRLILSQFREAPATLREAVSAAMERVLKSNTRVVTRRDLDELVRRAESLREDQDKERFALANEYLSAKNHAEQMLEDDAFGMPAIRVDAVRRFTELQGAVTTPGSSIQHIALAEQLVSFHLDERGATLHSESDVGGLFGGPMPRSLEFDQPFLLMLVRRGAPRPYFALWVGGPDVLELSANQPEPRKPGEGLLGDRMPSAPDAPPATTDTESPTTQQAGESPTTQP